MIRVDLDTPGRDRLLPETCLEQQLVSYTKGCYLGQEVIARVRTYGAIKFALRAILFGESIEDIESIKPSGEHVILDSGKKVGQFISRSWSPARGSAVALAYLDRDHRTPGTTLRFEGINGILEGTVALLPLYQAADQSARAQQKYDEGIRVFADGDESKACSHMEEALRLDPSFTDAYEALGLMLGRSQKYHEAIDFFRRLEEVAPQEPMVNTNLSVYYMKVGDKEGAEAEAAKAMQKELLRSRGEDLSAAEVDQQQKASMREQAERKLDMFLQVLEIDEVDSVALYGLGNAYATLEDWANAEAMYTRGVAAQKDNSAMYLGLGKTLEALQRISEAIEIYRQGMEVASRRGDLMPLKDMENRVLLLSAMKGSAAENS
jgi:folate-binding protein YgfZ